MLIFFSLALSVSCSLCPFIHFNLNARVNKQYCNFMWFISVHIRDRHVLLACMHHMRARGGFIHIVQTHAATTSHAHRCILVPWCLKKNNYLKWEEFLFSLFSLSDSFLGGFPLWDPTSRPHFIELSLQVDRVVCACVSTFSFVE